LSLRRPVIRIVRPIRSRHSRDGGVRQVDADLVVVAHRLRGLVEPLPRLVQPVGVQIAVLACRHLGLPPLQLHHGAPGRP
jgi:hypothetical protein